MQVPYYFFFTPVNLKRVIRKKMANCYFAFLHYTAKLYKTEVHIWCLILQVYLISFLWLFLSNVYDIFKFNFNSGTFIILMLLLNFNFDFILLIFFFFLMLFECIFLSTLFMQQNKKFILLHICIRQFCNLNLFKNFSSTDWPWMKRQSSEPHLIENYSLLSNGR